MDQNFEPLSQASYFLQAKLQNNNLASATCFFIKRNDKLYLITNWHVVSGMYPNTKTYISTTTLAEPDHLLVKLHKNQDTIDFEEFKIDLKGLDGRPLWLEHPIHGSAIDVIGIEVDIPQNLLAIDIEEFIEPYNENTVARVKNDVFVIGYPFGMSAGNIFPIWKRASIASEPCIDIDGLPKIFVDTASRQGMSGSPVIFFERRPAAIADMRPDIPGAKISHNLMALVGIYSGRIGVDETQINAQLGIVWKRQVIDEILGS